MKTLLAGKFLRINFAAMAVGLFLSSCGSNVEEQVKGEWYGFDDDSAYFELYINDTMIVLNNEQYGPIGYDYELKGKQLIVSNSAGMERTWKIDEIGSEMMVLTDSVETLRYSRLALDNSFFSTLSDSSSFNKFIERFQTRLMVHSKK